jgi:hypothetical protein
MARYSDKLHVAVAFNSRIYLAGVWHILRFIHDKIVTGKIRYCIAGSRTRNICLYIARYTGLVNCGVKHERSEFKGGEFFRKATIKNNDLLSDDVITLYRQQVEPVVSFTSNLHGTFLKHTSFSPQEKSGALLVHSYWAYQETTTPWPLNFINVFTKADRSFLSSLFNIADIYPHY